MSEALNAEKILASIIVELRENIVESRKDTAKIRDSVLELRGSISELIGDVLELRSNITEHGRRIDNILEEVADTRADLFHASTKIEDTNKDLNVVKDKLDDNNRKLDDNNRKLDENNHRLGKLTNKVGEIVEKIVLPGIVDKFNEKGFKFDSVSANVEFLNKKKDGNIAEVDALLENGKFVIALESKTELKISDVNAYMKRLQALRKISRFKGKKIYGAFSTAVTKPRPINYALDKGFYVLQQPDVMAVRILDFPKGRSAKAW